MNKSKIVVWLALLSLCLVRTGQALATPLVRWSGSSSMGVAIPTGNPNEWDISLVAGSASVSYWVYPPAAGVGVEKIRTVLIQSPNNGNTVVSLGLSEAPGSQVRRFASVKNVVLEAQTSNRTGFTVIGALNTTGNVDGQLEVHGISDSDVGGNIIGPVNLVSHSTAKSYVALRAGGSILGDVNVPDSQDGDPGEVFYIDAGGTIGTATVPVYIRVSRNVELLRAGEINAFVTGWGSGEASFVQWVEEVSTFTAGGYTGIFRGRIDTGNIADQSTDNFIDFAGPMVGDIRLGFGHIGAGNIIHVPTGGMQGQIVIRALGQEHVWQKPVYVGAVPNPPDVSCITPSTDLCPRPNYDETSGEIGGGSVGLVPYYTHFTDCFPQFSTVFSEFPTLDYVDFHEGGVPVPIRVRHYGPVILPSGQRAFKVERRKVQSEDGWIDESACFTETLDTTNSNVVNLSPVRPLQAGFEYRVTQELTSGSPRLTCDLVVIPSTPPPVALFHREFKFTICGPSLGDADSSTYVEFPDITSVLANFGKIAIDCNKDGDADRDGIVDFADVIAVLANFLATYCPPKESGGGEGMMGASSGGMALGEALGQLGYESIQDLVAAVSAMSDEDMNAELNRLGELLQSGSEVDQ